MRGRLGSIGQPENSLFIAREGFVFRGVNIYNKLNESLKREAKSEKFKTGDRNWVKDNIPIKPSPKYPNFSK